MPLRQYDPGMRLVGADPRQWEKLSAVMTLASVSAFALIWLSVPSGLVLPVFSAVCLLTGFSMAAAAWSLQLRRHLGRVTCWDVAGTCVVVGFVAGVLADHEHVAALVTVAAQ